MTPPHAGRLRLGPNFPCVLSVWCLVDKRWGASTIWRGRLNAAYRSCLPAALISTTGLNLNAKPENRILKQDGQSGQRKQLGGVEVTSYVRTLSERAKLHAPLPVDPGQGLERSLAPDAEVFRDGP